MPDYVSVLKKQNYRVFGEHKHSAAKLCLWTKKSLRSQGFCYKQKFYGVQSHRCLQMTPCIYCNQRCVFCWRAWEHEPAGFAPREWDEPDKLAEESIRAQRLLLSGFGGFEGCDKQKLKEAQNPNQAAISLDGEPTMYPYLGELIREYARRKFTTFLVTNGQFPKRLDELEPLPTQLYVSLDAPDKLLFSRVNVPLAGASWENLVKTLELFPSLDTRRVVRITLIKPLNMIKPESYAKLLEKTEADFVELKSYMAVGFSRQRGLGIDNMPQHEEVAEFAEKINEKLGYELVDEKRESRVVLLSSGAKQAKI